MAVFFLMWFGISAARHAGDTFLNVGFFEIPSVLGRCPGSGPVPTLAEGFRLTDPARIIVYTVAFTAGVVTLFSPCGFPLLPAYIPFFLGKNPSIRKALIGGGVTTAGFAVVLIAIAVVLSFTTGFLSTNFVYHRTFDIIAASIVIAMGLFMVLKLSIPFLPTSLRSTANKGYASLFVFGSSWGGAALMCVSPLFISVAIFTTLLNPALLIPAFATYAVGMGLPVIIVSVILGGAKRAYVNKLVLWSPKLQRPTGLLIIAVGIYIFVDNVFLLPGI